jgi:uncharacterized FlaG/YvyC family protein
MASATTSTTVSSRQESSARAAARPVLPPAGQDSGRKTSTAPEAKPDDFGVTVAGRFDPNLRRFFVTILDTSSGVLIAQFPSKAAASYAQQIAKAAGETDLAPKNADIKTSQELRLDQRT